jgi:hypothetical protein
MHARLIRSTLTGLGVVLTLGVTSLTGQGCLDRPVVPGEPSTKTNFTTQVAEQAVDKLDILFSIDNSASMGDKQAYLDLAIPDLINRLLTPNCVSNSDNTTVVGVSSISPKDGSADCSAFPNSAPEFPAVHNMHIGIVSSSLGPRLGDKQPSDGSGGECLPTATITLPNPSGTQVTLNNHNDDQAHLLTRSATPADTVDEVTPLPDAASSGFLTWFPNAAANLGKDAGADTTPITSGTQLETDFQDMIDGVHEYGCGIESQLESWYRFLIQPDPYASLQLSTGGSSPAAQWVGVDTTILKERHDFLRPDSLVAVIVLSDENDSEIDVRSIGGQGYLFMSTKFYPPHGTAPCAATPGASGCSSLGSSDTSPYNSPTDWGYDLNLRHVHMQAKYGLNPQFPITRYENGLTSASVPDRDGKGNPSVTNGGEYPPGANNYVGNNDCTNPLFAASLPDGTGLSSAAATATSLSATDAAYLCNLPKSTARSKSLIFYAVIGGVPWQLLHFDPTNAANSELTAADWVRILGTDPDTYNYQGIDAHMIESYYPRTGAGDPKAPANTTGTPSFPVASLLPALSGVGGTSAAETAPTPVSGTETLADPYNGGEWITNQGAHLDLNVDREYACIFKLVDPTTGAPAPRDCSKTNGQYTVPANGYACDCSSTGLASNELSPVCDPMNPNSQLYAKAYPTIRELNLANKLGANGIVSSICPIDVADNAAGDDPLFGYRPAVSSIINRLKNALTNQCLPQTLSTEDAGAGVPCLILATLPNASNPSNPQADCSNASAYPGMTPPDPTILQQFETAAVQAWNQGGQVGPNPSTLPTCQVNQITSPSELDANGSCKSSSTPGWCYVTGVGAGTCAQAILFSPGAIPTGSTINLQCIETSSALAAGSSGDGG